MTKQVSSPNSVANAPSVSRPFAVALLGLGMASFVFAPAQTALGAHPAKTPAQEESVLVATREAPATETKTGNTAAADALEPIAQSSDRNPEVASGSESSEDAGSHFRRRVGQDRPAAEARKGREIQPINETTPNGERCNVSRSTGNERRRPPCGCRPGRLP